MWKTIFPNDRQRYRTINILMCLTRRRLHGQHNDSGRSTNCGRNFLWILIKGERSGHEKCEYTSGRYFHVISDASPEYGSATKQHQKHFIIKCYQITRVIESETREVNKTALLYCWCNGIFRGHHEVPRTRCQQPRNRETSKRINWVELVNENVEIRAALRSAQIRWDFID